jgi:hypothetical protein
MSEVGIQAIEKSWFDTIWSIYGPNVKNTIVSWLLKLEKNVVLVYAVPLLL